VICLYNIYDILTHAHWMQLYVCTLLDICNLYMYSLYFSHDSDKVGNEHDKISRLDF